MRDGLLAPAAIALLAAATAPASAAGAQAPSVRAMRLAVQTTLIHVVDWHLQDAAYPDPKRSWVQGRGTQTLGFSDRRPVTYVAVALSGRGPGGAPFRPLALTPAKSPKPLRASLRRTADWHFNTCGAGTDRVLADAADVVSRDCEQVERGGAVGGAATGGVRAGTGTLTPTRIRLRAALARGFVGPSRARRRVA